MATATVQSDKDEQKPNVSAYLQAPRKKRKNYVIIACSEDIDAETVNQIEGFVKKQYPQLATSRPKTLKELTRQFGRNISLLIVDDRFEKSDKLMQAIAMLKLKSKKDTVPVIFLTENPQALVQRYHTHLVAYQENDDYCDLKRFNMAQIIGRIKIGIDAKNRRRSRRYKVALPVQLFQLSISKTTEARLLDLSIHGCLIRCSEPMNFRLNDQVKLKIPGGRYLDPEAGEFINLSARVRRVFISGDMAALQFVHLNETQTQNLTKFVTAYAMEQILR